MFKRLTRLVVAPLLVGAILLIGFQGVAMAKMVIFSEVQGKVLQNGVPVPDAVIEREFRWSWKDEVGNDVARTDQSGDFKLGRIERSSLLGSVLPHEPNIEQTILIKVGGKTYKAWMFRKRDYKLNGELDGKPIVMTCRLESEPAHTGKVFGICELK